MASLLVVGIVLLVAWLSWKSSKADSDFRIATDDDVIEPQQRIPRLSPLSIVAQAPVSLVFVTIGVLAAGVGVMVLLVVWNAGPWMTIAVFEGFVFGALGVVGVFFWQSTVRERELQEIDDRFDSVLSSMDE